MTQLRMRKQLLPQAWLTWIISLMAVSVAAFFFWILGDLLVHGWHHLSLDFLLESPRNAGREGGIAPVLVATLFILGSCLVVALPLGLGTAVLLSEFVTGTGLARWIRRGLDILAGVPSIVFGLFGNAFFCVYLGFGFSILSGGLTLACMCLPYLIHTLEAGLSAVPLEQRAAGAALGWTRFAILRHLVLPQAKPALLAGLVLSVARVLTETAALMFTSGYVDRLPRNLLDSGRSLSIHIYDLTMNVAGGDGAAYASALILIGLTLLINAFFALLQDKADYGSRRQH